MTARELLGMLGRRWYVVTAVLAAAALLTWHLASTAAAGVYSTRTAVTFLYGYDSALSLEGSLRDENVIAFAGAVAAEVVPGQEAIRYSAVDAPYYGAGLREGVQVGLVDYGNQWAPSYAVAVIVLQIVGPSAEWVEAKQTEALRRVEYSSYLRRQPGTPADIRIRVDPLTLRIEHIRPERTAQVAALGAMTVAGLLTSVGSAVGFDRALAHRTRRGGRTARTRGIAHHEEMA
ncbi:hypothetical protein B5M43_004845 [Microbacterium sp. MEC084]|uniref:hypothetical protein n=1 Tax=Microbacterium sp. MEC084 TaxID=1963027 RepID=UPI00106F9C18|nr:hypothetical protein [Microbacterium sp. MEC084]MCD1268178.1 hypothetical protein [Microbacterium sp. MEC084]